MRRFRDTVPVDEAGDADPRRLESSGEHAVRDPMGDSPGLAGTGACDDAYRAMECGRDGALLWVESVEDVGRRRHGVHPGSPARRWPQGASPRITGGGSDPCHGKSARL